MTDKCDSRRRPWLKKSDVKDGMIVELDGGFTCCQAGHIFLHKDNDQFFFHCNEGRHYLNGQAEGDHYIGIYLADNHP